MSSKNSTKGKGKRRRVDKFYQLAKEQGENLDCVSRVADASANRTTHAT